MDYFAGRADSLFSLSIYFVVLCPALSARRSLTRSILEFPASPSRALSELNARFFSESSVRLDSLEISRAQGVLLQKIESFRTNVSDFLPARILPKDEAFRVLKQTLNFDQEKISVARLKHDTFLDYSIAESHLECHRSHLRVDDYYVKVLTLKEPPPKLSATSQGSARGSEPTSTSSPNGRRRSRARRAGRSRPSAATSTTPNVRSSAKSTLRDAPPHDTLLDDSKESQVRELGEGIEEIELHGNYFGQFSLTVVIYDRDLAAAENAAAEFYKVFSVHDAQLYEEQYNLLNAFLAAVPGNYAFNLRYLYLLNTNYADFSFLFTLQSGEPRNPHLRQEYLAVLETNHGHAVLPKSPLPRCRAHHDSRPNGKWQVVSPEFPHHQSPEI